ncbi:DUF3726 domain-containing protein [Shewanella psychropiezotolerans]|uniref:DUF3726 domain-containing protein n=1 Tax=Shewanella psychropiezotolerans TaxID=2593655 RepID=A0ABX5WZN3_9GAMM|nr:MULTISPECIES: DUF3726 domain-containing protein [Shewanella]MPY22498.1 DUF3726 domain-containing protein [Shewanella sp. YLB-07]QDO83188.1 DUF3726 domain-containing protein [Shewanella psychropiezotolerans]
MIQISHNELVTLCTKAFIGLHKNCGEADVIANMVADLEMVGLDGIKHFIKALDFLADDLDSPVKVDTSSEQRLSVNLKGSSILCHLPSLLDYSLEKLADQQTVSLQISHCHNRWLAFGELIKLAQNGLSVKASWNNGPESIQLVYILGAGQSLPELYLTQQKADDQHSLSIEISRQSITHPLAGDMTQHITSSMQAERKRKAWKQGISVSRENWDTIKSVASTILVESNIVSLRGAGADHQLLVSE